jgi:chondroitin 4-sulfotransferase 11
MGLPGFRGLEHFSPTRMYVDAPARLVLVLNPKVATTFLREALTDGLKLHRGWSDASEGRYRIFGMARRFPTARVRDYIAVLRRPEDFRLYAFVRNPYARLLSAWKDKFFNGHHRGYPKRFLGTRLNTMRAFARAHGLPGGEEDTLIPFETFIANVLAGEIGRMDHHWDAQHSVLMMDRFRYERLYRIETERDVGMVDIFSKLGIAQQWTLARAREARNESGRDKSAGYTEATAQQVFNKFRRDFESFGYDAESWRD